MWYRLVLMPPIFCGDRMNRKHPHYRPCMDNRTWGIICRDVDAYYARKRGSSMPYRIERPCRAYLCPNTTSNANGYCDEHQSLVKDRRGSARTRGYDTRWERFRLLYLHQHPLCVDCQQAGRPPTPATEVHHIHRLRDYPGMKYDEDNLMALCHKCHSRRTAKGE